MSDTPTITPEAPPVEIHTTRSNTVTNKEYAAHKDVIVDRTGEFISEMFNVVERHVRPEIMEVQDPRDGFTSYAVLGAGGEVKSLSADLFDKFRSRPMFREGTANVTTLASFIELVNRYSIEGESVIFGTDSINGASLTAIIDYNPTTGTKATLLDGVPKEEIVKAGEGDTGRRKHKVTYAFPFSDEWKAWMAHNGKWMTMTDLAEFLEERIIDVVPEPEVKSEEGQRFLKTIGGNVAGPSKLMELSRNLAINEESKVVNKQNLSSGEAQIQFETRHTDQTGAPVNIPNVFVIALPIFRRSNMIDQLIVRLRYRVQAGQVAFCYDIWRADLAFQMAFDEAAEDVAKSTELPIYLGTSEAASA